MSPLIRIYDNIASNKGVSLGIAVLGTALMAYRVVSFIEYASPMVWGITACAGVAFALLAKYYLVDNREVKNDNERTGIYSTLSLIVTLSSLNGSPAHNIFTSIFYLESTTCYLNGFGVGFTATMLAIQLIEYTSIKFSSPKVLDS